MSTTLPSLSPLALCVAALGLSDAALAARETACGGDEGRIEVVVLGSGHPVIDDDHPRMQPATAVLIGDDRWLADAGAGALARLYDHGVPAQSLTHVFLTHLHVDHVVDLDGVLLAWHFATPGKLAGAPPDARSDDGSAGRGPKKRLPARSPGSLAKQQTGRAELKLYGPTGTAEMVQTLLDKAYGVDGRGRALLRDASFTVQDLSAPTPIEGEGYRVELARVNHAWMDSWALRFETECASVVITGDLGSPLYPGYEDHAELAAFSRGADILVVDALHLAPEVLVRFATEAAPKHLVLSHLSEDTPSFNRGYTTQGVLEKTSARGPGSPSPSPSPSP